MIQKCHDTKSIIPMIPTMCNSTVNTTDNIYEGCGINSKVTFRLVSNIIEKWMISLTICYCQLKQAMNGLRVKLTYTFSAVGTMAPIFISVLGFMERALPEDEEIDNTWELYGKRGIGWHGIHLVYYTFHEVTHEIEPIKKSLYIMIKS